MEETIRWEKRHWS